MRRYYQATGVVLLLFALAVGYQALQFRYFSYLGPGPGFFPVWTSGILLVLSLAMIAQATFGPEEPKPAELAVSRKGAARVIAMVAALVVLIAVFEWLGFRLSMFAFYIVVLTILGGKNLVVSVIVAALGSFGCYYAFVHWLRVPLPVGVFGI